MEPNINIITVLGKYSIAYRLIPAIILILKCKLIKSFVNMESIKWKVTSYRFKFKISIRTDNGGKLFCFVQQ
jgi:hypothetical protein